MARILSPTPENLELAGRALAAGEPVGMPTETVYGLAARVFDEEALARVYSVKERPTFDPLIAHAPASVLVEAAGPLAALERLELVDGAALGAQARSRAELLARAFWPGPLTLVLPRHARVPDLATGGLATVGVRVPRQPVAQALIAAAGAPLAAPSANRFGRISPTTAAAVDAELGDRVGLILDGGLCEIGLESTVVGIAADGALMVLRPGAITREQLEAAAGAPVAAAGRPYAGTAAPSAPGMLASHYAPSTPLRLLPRPVSALGENDRPALTALLAPARSAALLIMAGDAAAEGRRLGALLGVDVTALALSRDGDLSEIARHLFDGLRRLDASGAAVILAEPSPSETGLGFAIGDRLARAAHRS